MYCVFNENLISFNHVQHIRQFKEDREGNRYSLLNAGYAIIEPQAEQYVAKSLNDDIIAISDCLNTIIKRIKKADKDADIIVKLNEKEYTIEEYLDLLKPTIYRLSHGMSEKTGFIAALDYIKAGKVSDIKIFYDSESIEEYIKSKQIDNDYYFVFSKSRQRIDLNAGGLDMYELDKKDMQTEHLSKVLKDEREILRTSIENEA